jgi:hypothetical protein
VSRADPSFPGNRAAEGIAGISKKSIGPERVGRKFCPSSVPEGFIAKKWTVGDKKKTPFGETPLIDVDIFFVVVEY